MIDPSQDRRTNSGIEVKLDLLHGDVQDMKSVLKELTAAISRLAVVESDQNHIRAGQERTFGVLEKLEMRIAALEALSVSSKHTGVWVDRAIWGTVAAVAMYVAKKVGLVS